MGAELVESRSFLVVEEEGEERVGEGEGKEFWIVKVRGVEVVRGGVEEMVTGEGGGEREGDGEGEGEGAREEGEGRRMEGEEGEHKRGEGRKW